MTILVPTCAEVTARLTDYAEGSLGPVTWVGLRLHLAACPPCRAFLQALARTGALVDQAWDARPSPRAESALAGALALLRSGRIPQGPGHHPEAGAWAALEGGDPFMALLLRVHLSQCASCRAERGDRHAIAWSSEAPVDSLRPHLPPEATWRWTTFAPGARITRLLEDGTRGVSLSLARLEGGRRVPTHDHLGPEVSVLLCGGLQDGPAHLRAGDWISHDPGDRHGPEADTGGECWALIRLETGLRFEGWRGLLGTLR